MATVVGTSGFDTFIFLIDSGRNFGLEDDRVAGLDGIDNIYTGAGNDFIDGGNDGDQLSGGDGDDTVVCGTGDDHIFADGGNDTYYGGEGVDTLDFRFIAWAQASSLISVTVKLWSTLPARRSRISASSASTGCSGSNT